MKTCLLQLKKKKKKEKKNTKTFTFTTLLNHVILRDDQPILMIELHTIWSSLNNVSRIKNLNKNIGWKGGNKTSKRWWCGLFIIRTPNDVGDNFGAVGSNNRLNGQTIQVMLELDLNEQSYLFFYFLDESSPPPHHQIILEEFQGIVKQ
jgi:hypothetical protein